MVSGVLLFACLAGWFVIRLYVHGATSHSDWWKCQSSTDSACVDAAVKRFHDIDYTESKDLAKSFLTLLVGVFVASVTFTEK